MKQSNKPQQRLQLSVQQQQQAGGHTGAVGGSMGAGCTSIRRLLVRQGSSKGPS
jgi:hypothetical protein